ncbi:hypothetical protein Q2T40_08155 [Winogradskyella maritima]|uniref:DUF6602 domain-containing protein n=1 Tax=Winogradskyella maritima TaxID=1517766 RepID=A0ABV8ALI1_9FLAO|nr:hypothetical protein [Winogradskyella maritima]
MNSKDFLELIKFETDEINHLFKKASVEGKGTSQEVSDRREIAVKLFLERYFPFPYRVAKGNIIDSYGLRSNSIDCILLSPSHPYTVSNENKYSVIFADGVDVAVEVKPDLSNINEIHRSLEQIKSVKNLRRQKSGLFNMNKKHNDEQLLTSKQIPCVIFGNKTYSNIETLIKNIGLYYLENKIQMREQFDMIIINGKGILFNSRSDYSISFSDEFQGLFFAELDEQTLAVFLFYLNIFPQCEMKMGEPVLNYYYQKPDTYKVKYIKEINKRLLELG